MSNMFRRWTIVLAVLPLLASCVENSNQPFAPVTSSEPVHNQTPPSEFPVSPLADIDLEAVGALKPGAAITIRASFKGRHNGAVSLSLLVLDTDSIQATDGSQGHARLLGTWSGSFQPDLSRQLAAQLTFRRSGYYRVLARVARVGSGPTMSGDSVIPEISIRYLWMVIDEAGGRLTDGFDPEAIRGKAVEHGSYGAFKVAAAPVARIMSSSTGGATVINAQLTFFSGDTNTRLPLSNMPIYALCLDANDFTVSQHNLTTDASGNFSVTCASTATQFNAIARPYNSYMTIRGKDNAEPTGSLYLELSGGTLTPAYYFGNDPAAQTWKYLRPAADSAVSKFGYSPGQVPVHVADNDSTYAVNYDYTKVNLRTSHVYGDYGHFVIVHEYGHAYQDKAFAYINDGITTDYNCPSAHYITAEYSLACALVEGWADFFAAWLTHHVLDTWGSQFEDFNVGAGDGARIEAAIAAFLYDLVDTGSELDGAGNTQGSAESFDTYSLAPDYVANIMRTCQVRTSGPLWITPVNGIDAVIYCMEKTLESQNTGYFMTRSQSFDSYSEAATEPGNWSKTSIRALWKKNLYDD